MRTYLRSTFSNSLVAIVAMAVISGCSAGSHNVVPSAGGSAPSAARMAALMPHSISPALVKATPMAKTAPLPASAMSGIKKPDIGIQGLGWAQLPGLASQVTAAPDGTIWVLSDQPAGPDKYIWHFDNGTWTNISGLASEIAVTKTGLLFAINSGGGTYLFSNGNWAALGGGAKDITAAADGTTYVLSNGGTGPDRAIWHNVAGTWTQVPGAGVKLAASWDTRSYTVPGGSVNAGGFYVLNSSGGIFYGNTDGSYASFPGAASDVTASPYGGFYALGYPTSGPGETIYYYNLDSPGWTALPGLATSISEAGSHLYAVTAAGLIFVTNAQTTAGTALTNTNSSGFGNVGWGPFDIANAFQFPVQSGYDGAGETIAIVINAFPASTDMSTYLNNFGITRRGMFTTESVDGGGLVDTEGEATLDSETIAGLAPGANVIVYDTPDLSGQHTLDAYNQILSDGKANVVSMSYGGCESAGEDTTVGRIFAQMAAQGIAAVASSGDTGNACFNGSTTSDPVGVESPASVPDVIGVGGVETTIPGSVIGTAIWNDCPTPLTTPQNCMGGGGVSGNVPNGFAGYPIPSYQVGLAGVTSTSLRNVPDVSYAADHVLVFQGSWQITGGTSWSAPQTAALVAEIYQYCGVTSIRNPVNLFYTAFAQDVYNDFSDVTSGNNSFMGETPSYTAAAGYDNATGIGQPLGMPIARRICPNNVPALVNTAVHGTVALEPQGQPVARVLQNIPNLASRFGDLGERASSSPTRVAFVMRASSSLAQNEQTLVDALQSSGFTVVRRFSNHLVVDAEAPASVVERYFNTRIHDFSQGRYGVRYANTQPVVLPASISYMVDGVLTQNLVLAHVPPKASLPATPTLPRR